MAKISPAPGSIPGPDDITRVELSNGIVVFSRPNFNSPSVTIIGALEVGSLFDPQEKLGLSDFTASAMMRGTQHRDFHQIYDALESVGASLGFSGGTHTSGFSAKGLVEDIPLILELLAEVLIQPAFPSEQVERLRAQIMTGLTIRAQSTGDRAAMAFDEIVYAGHPYSKSEEGYPETVQAITREDIADFHTQHYGPAGMRIAIVGGIAPEDAVSKVETILGSWQNPQQPAIPDLPDLSPLPESISQRIEIAGKFQSDIVLGTAGPKRSDADYLPAAVGNNILGQFGMMGRIGEVVREQAGLAYYASSSISGGLGPGPWAFFAGVDPQNEGKAIDLIFSEARRFVDELVTEEELADTQANLVGRMPLGLESNAGVAASLLNIEKHDLGLDYYQQFPDLIRAVTREQIREAAQHYLKPDKFAVSVAGPPLKE